MLAFLMVMRVRCQVNYAQINCTLASWKTCRNSTQAWNWNWISKNTMRLIIWISTKYPFTIKTSRLIRPITRVTMTKMTRTINIWRTYATHSIVLTSKWTSSCQEERTKNRVWDGAVQLARHVSSNTLTKIILGFTWPIVVKYRWLHAQNGFWQTTQKLVANFFSKRFLTKAVWA